MRLLILFCVITITIATSIERQTILDLLDGKSVTLSSFVVKKQVGLLPDPYQPLTSEDHNSTKKAEDYAEFLRPHFPSGYEKIPPLDPFQPIFDPIPINISGLRGELLLSGVKVTGAQEFKLEDLALRLNYKDKRIRGDGAILLPSLQVVADFKVNVKIASIPISLDGKFTAQITDVKARGAIGTSLQIRFGGPDIDQMDAAELEAREGQVVVKFQFDDPEAAQLVKAGVPDQAKIDEMHEKVEVLAMEVALKQINEVLGKYTDEEIRAIIQ